MADFPGPSDHRASSSASGPAPFLLELAQSVCFTDLNLGEDW